MSLTTEPAAPQVAPNLVVTRRGWRAPLREFAVIAAGVLCALAAQAWWESREDRERERDYLEQLLVDTRENESRLAVAIAADSSSRAALDRLGTVLYQPGRLPPADTMVLLFVSDAFGSSNFKPLAGTHEALLAAGDLRLIRTDSLRAGIVAYAASLEHERAMLEFYLLQAFSDVDRIGRTLPFMRRVFSGPAAMLADVRNSGFSFDRARADPDLSAILFALQIANRNRLTHLRSLRDETRALRLLLEAESAIRR